MFFFTNEQLISVAADFWPAVHTTNATLLHTTEFKL